VDVVFARWFQWVDNQLSTLMINGIWTFSHLIFGVGSEMIQQQTQMLQDILQ
jgi:hypothetical protein